MPIEYKMPEFYGELLWELKGDYDAGVLVPIIGSSGKSNGECLLICHGFPDGTIRDPWCKVALEADIPVACCYPILAQEKNPDLHILGDWHGKTWINWDTNLLTITESEE